MSCVLKNNSKQFTGVNAQGIVCNVKKINQVYSNGTIACDYIVYNSK